MFYDTLLEQYQVNCSRYEILNARYHHIVTFKKLQLTLDIISSYLWSFTSHHNILRGHKN
jgi:hypothetical protein